MNDLFPTTTGLSPTTTDIITTNIINISNNTDLQTLNDQRVVTLIPAILVLGLLMITGIVGNSLVCYIFCFRLKSGTQNFLIICLACFDLLSCCIGIPSEISDMRFYYLFPSEPLCKIMRFVNTFTAIGSIFTLLIIAIDRYRKICKPFGRQIGTRHLRLSFALTLVATVFFSWPAIFLYGLRVVPTKIPGLYGRDCSTDQETRHTNYPLIYNLVLFFCFILVAIVLTILYCFVLRETKRHNRYLKRNSDFSLPSTGSFRHSEDSCSSVDQVVNGHNQAVFDPAGEQVRVEGGVFDYGPIASSTSTSVTARPESGRPRSGTQTTLLGTPLHQHGDHEVEEDGGGQSGQSDTGITHISDSCNGSTSPMDDANPARLNERHASPLTNGNLSQFAYDNPIFDRSDLQISSDSARSSDLQISTESVRSTTPVLPSGGAAAAKRSSLASSNGRQRRSLSVTILGEDGLPHRTIDAVKKRRRHLRSKTTIIAFLVTLVFILSFLPHLSLQISKIMINNFDSELEGAALVAYNIFLRSYFINSVSNPLIYAALNLQFKREVRSVVKKLCRRATS